MSLINLRKLIALRKGDSAIFYKMGAELPLPTHENIDETALEFESRFESGNLIRASRIATYEYNLLL
jgi:hypothetical protein